MGIEDQLDDPRIEALGMLLETHAELINALAHDLGETTGSPVPWIGVLIRLARAPGHRMRMSELARDMTISASGLTRLIDRVEAEGHVERQACPEDRRGLWCVLTDVGRQELARVVPCHVESLDRLLATPLSADELARLTDLLRRVRDHIRSI